MNIKGSVLRGATFALALGGALMAQGAGAGGAYTMTNAADDNSIVVFDRNAQGLLTKTAVVATGGKGSGGGLDPLGSQGSLLLEPHGRWLLAVNAGSNDISVFKVMPDGIALTDRIGSGGTMPVSVTVSGDTVYVLNEGAPANITGFTLNHLGHLNSLAGSTRLLGGGAYAQVAFTPDGSALAVTDKADDQLLVYRIGNRGLPVMAPATSPSSGHAPFGVVFDEAGNLLVAEAGSGAVSSYHLTADGALRVLTASAANGQKATCWIAINHRGDVITANPGSQSLSTYRVGHGRVTLRNGAAAAASAPLDVALSVDGRFLYAVDPKNGGVDMFSVGRDGSLTAMGSVDGGLGLYAQGMAVH